MYSQKQFDKAIVTINQCIRLEPSAHDLYLTGGILYEKVGDSISSKKYFEKSLTIVNQVLDTMNVEHLDYEMLVSNKAINLIMLGNNKEGHDLLLLVADRQQELESKRMSLSLMNKNKKELVEMFTDNPYSR